MTLPENVGIITQARMTSSRLPGKIMLKAGGKTLLEHHLERLGLSGINKYIATTADEEDKPIRDFARKNDLPFFAGSRDNVLSRYYEAAKEFGLNIIIRVTSDCPLIDGALVKQGLNRFKQNYSSGLYLSNCVERTYPRGMDFEIFTFDLLEDAHYNAKEPYELEHVTPYINKNRSGKVRIYSMKQNRDNSMYRLTVDEEDDYKLIKELIETYHAENYDFEKIVLIMDKHPELAEINKNVSQKAG